ncbi:sub C, member 16 [Desmophyllum pertusum]|uniref:DnaJ homolog subfamily C member 16 n=1 Tax=Desmophyllum pertusum TaxID=174260 RepID=A0A9X0DCZ6_9CNID|nr:sub C, member 16 [Desmophyllum pertusum]
MARNWHPDKNDEPGAQEMFIKINEANEILSDEQKKKNFDMYGPTGHPSSRGKPFYDPHSGFSFFFNGMPFQNTWSKPGQINYRAYYKAVLPESYEKPYLIEIISDWCFACAQIEETWEEASNSMKKVGVGIGIINANRSPRLVDALGAGRVPTIIGVINGRVIFFSDSVTVQGLKDFVIALFPNGLIEKVTVKNVDSFLTTGVSNKPSVILFSPKPLPSLLYHLVAFSNYKQQSFGFVSLTDSSGEPVRKRFRVDSKEPTVLIFKDDVAVPEVVVMASELTSGKLREVAEAHKYLHFPRLSSRSLFDGLCPEERFRSQRRLCVILFTKQGQHEKEKLVLKLLATDKKYLSQKRVKFFYLYEGIQGELLDEFKDGRKDDRCADNSTAAKMIILWNKGRKQSDTTGFQEAGVCQKLRSQLTKTRLTVMLDDLLSGEGKITLHCRIPLIYNEHAPGLISALFRWCTDAFYYVRFSMYQKETLSLFSLLCGLGVILFFSVLLPSASDSIERAQESVRQKEQQAGPQSDLSSWVSFVWTIDGTSSDQRGLPSQVTLLLALR